jgi:Tol biopolymer transport system component
MTDAIARLTVALADRYAIERELGAGGMATVYLAQDLRHERKVALKVLRPELASILGGARFLTEIKTTANLQHPHILSLFDSGEADGLVFYVMPYVEGESLRDRLAREKQLPVEEAVRIACEVADALEYAHAHGVVHRDIKPENILLHGGHAMVADFGIALAASRSDGGTRMTETGMSLGTPHYMSPEQAMGEKEITPKADIYALGCVLYEMLTAEPPFTGATAQAIVARVMTEHPRALTLQRHTIPRHVEAAVLRALEKLPADRFSSAAQFAEALGRPDLVTFAEPPLAVTRGAGSGMPARAAGRRWLAALPWALVALVAGAGAWGWLRGRPFVPDPVARFTVPLPPSAGYFDAAGVTVAMSPDGARIVYVGRDDHGVVELFQRSLDQFEPVPIPGTRNGSQPFFSPDGLWLGFVVQNKVQKVALAGGPPLTVCAADSGFVGASWGRADVIVFGTGVGLRQVPAAGGEPTAVTKPDTARDVTHMLPDFLPDGKAVLFTIRGRDGTDRLAAATIATGVVKRFTQPGSNPHYVTSGHVVLSNLDGTIIAVPFDAGRVRVAGAAVPVAEGVPVGTAGAAKLGVSKAGSLVYASGSAGERSIVFVDRHGVAQALTTELRSYESPRLSPDGRRIAVDISERNGSKLWIWDIAQKTLTPLAFDNQAIRPVWTPDGRRLAYTRSDVGDIYWIAADGSAPPESLLVVPGRQLADALTPDGLALFYHENNAATTKNDIMYVRLDSARIPHVFLKTPADEFGAAVSPDGHWVAYTSDESGRSEVYVRSFPEPGGKVQVSLDGGSEARWLADGRELFYRNGDRMMAATISLRPTFAVLKRTELFRGFFSSNQFHAQYDVTRDGRHFVMTQGPMAASDLIVVLNWFDQLRGQRAATAAPGPARH